MNPRRRRRVALYAVALMLAGWAACRALFFAGVLSHRVMDSITNDLSWLALVVTAIDILATTDVRAETDKDG